MKEIRYVSIVLGERHALFCRRWFRTISFHFAEIFIFPYVVRAAIISLRRRPLICGERAFCSASLFGSKSPKYPLLWSELQSTPPPPPRKWKIVRDFRYEVTQVVSAKYPLPPPPNSKIADLDRVFKVGLAKYPPPPPENSKIADLDRVFKVGSTKCPPCPSLLENLKIADLDTMFKVALAKYPPPPKKKFKNSRFGQSVQS